MYRFRGDMRFLTHRHSLVGSDNSIEQTVQLEQAGEKQGYIALRIWGNKQTKDQTSFNTTGVMALDHLEVKLLSQSGMH